MKSFMKEHIKKKPFYKKRWFVKIAGTLCLGGIFGVTAALVFTLTLPWTQQNFGRPEVYSLGREITAETTNTDTTEGMSDSSGIQNYNQNIDLEDFKVLYEQIGDMANEAFRGMVTVSGVSSGTDLFQEVYESEKKASGMVIGMYSKRIYIVTEARAVEEAERVIVNLDDDTICDAEVKKTDEVSGLTVLEIDTENLTEEQLNSMTVLEFDTIETLERGDPVIALGNLTEGVNSMASGVVTSISDIPVIDSSYNIVNTDIAGSSKGSGILLNMDGKVVGIITRKFGSNEQSNICAISSNNVREILNDMTNTQQKVVMGITGKIVTENMAEELNMPQGFYVMSVAADSPAMYHGIQRGDILVSMKNTEILSQKDYQNILKQCKIGEEIPLEIMRKVRDGYSKMEIKVELKEQE